MADQVRPEKVFCGLTGYEIPIDSAVPVSTLSPLLVKAVRKALPQWSEEEIMKGYVSIAQLNKLHFSELKSMLGEEAERVGGTRKKLNVSAKEEGLLTPELHLDYSINDTIGERIASRLAKIGGSWQFVTSFVTLVFLWVIINTLIISGAFDPYPFSFLGLIIAFIAAVEVPIILMSQNRELKENHTIDINNHLVNLKAELEVRFLNEKLTSLFYLMQNRISELESTLSTCTSNGEGKETECNKKRVSKGSGFG